MDKKPLIESLNLPQDLQKLSQSDLLQLSTEIRSILLQIGEKCGGHLASNLGVVELSLALHSVFNSPVDQFVWDTSHQCYVHKLLTGRLKDMFSIKKNPGLSGFANIFESEHDIFGAGHASTALSAALGLAAARDLSNKNNHVLAIVGDASLSGGMSFEALNNAKDIKGNFICILNDNNMSISQPVGSFSNYITKLRSSPLYNRFRQQSEHIISKIPTIGVPLKKCLGLMMDSMRHMIWDHQIDHIFHTFGFRYLGPIDGHNIVAVMAALNYAKNYHGKIIIHVVTQKGKGYQPAEKNPTKFHGVKPKTSQKKVSLPSYSQIFSDSIVNIAKHNEDVVAITPAMCEGSGLLEFKETFPSRYFDVGIAEEHAVTFAAGLSRAGKTPVLAIYSTFLQRGFDQVIHDVCIQNLAMVFAIDRAGLIGEDGATHQGVFDLAFMNLIPNMIILAPKDGQELDKMLKWAVDAKKIVSIRYPKGSVPDTQGLPENSFQWNKAELLYDASPNPFSKLDICILSLGSPSWPAYQACLEISKTHPQFTVALLNLRSLKPLDTAQILNYLERSKLCLTLEEGCLIGGLHSRICQLIQSHEINIHCMGLGVNDQFIEHDSRNQQLSACHLDSQGIAKTLRHILLKHPLAEMPQLSSFIWV